MPLRSARSLLVAAVAIAVTATLASAQAADPAPPRVRGATIEAALLLDELVARSARRAISLVDWTAPTSSSMSGTNGSRA